MSTRGFWTDKGPCDGSFDVVQDIIYYPGHYPQQLPVAILVKFECFTQQIVLKEIIWNKLDH